jgi:hypothetical protein
MTEYVIRNGKMKNVGDRCGVFYCAALEFRVIYGFGEAAEMPPPRKGVKKKLSPTTHASFS